MPNVDLTPFGFTPTESVVYAALLQLGPSTGYGVSRATRLARANADGAPAAARVAARHDPGGARRPPGGRELRHRGPHEERRSRGHAHAAADRRRPSADRLGNGRADYRAVEHASAHCDAGPRRVAQSHL